VATLLRYYLTSILLVVASTQGLAVVYDQIDHGTRQNAIKHHWLSPLQENYPQILYLCLVIVLLHFIGVGTNNTLYWILLNIQVIVMLYSNLLIPNFLAFTVVQVVGAMTFVAAGGMTFSNWILFLIANMIVYGEHWYGDYLAKRPILYLLPPLFVGAMFWVKLHTMFPVRLNWWFTIGQYIAFAWAYYALWVYDNTRQHDQQVITKLTREAQYDALTRARNWFTFRHDLTQVYSELPTHFSLIVFDIDHFKQINDQHGHLVGNQVLMMVATQFSTILKQQNSRYDLYRTGGEEFAIILPTTDLQTATKIATMCQQQLRTMSITTTDINFQITASFGLAYINGNDHDATAGFKRADDYLYQSKRNGRDQITVEGQSFRSDQ
jgi:diguanylate cyclase (GGDEF)-like protein